MWDTRDRDITSAFRTSMASKRSRYLAIPCALSQSVEHPITIIDRKWMEVGQKWETLIDGINTYSKLEEHGVFILLFYSSIPQRANTTNSRTSSWVLPSPISPSIRCQIDLSHIIKTKYNLSMMASVNRPSLERHLDDSWTMTQDKVALLWKGNDPDLDMPVKMHTITSDLGYWKFRAQIDFEGPLEWEKRGHYRNLPWIHS